MLKQLRRRWRFVAFLTVVGVVALNWSLMGVPSVVSGRSDGGQSLPGDVEQARDYSHLQAARKRLNKSFNNSSNPDDPNHVMPGRDDDTDHVNKPEDEADDNFDDQNGDQKAEQESLSRNHQISSDQVDLVDEGYDDGIVEDRKPKKQNGVGSRANYSLPEIDEFVRVFQYKYAKSSFSLRDLNSSYIEMLQATNKLKKKGARLRHYISNAKSHASWSRFHYGIRQHNLYDPRDPYVDQLIRDMATKEIVDIEQKDGGTQIKLIITFADEGQALFKPMRFPRNQETLPDHFYFADYERHVAEIAAFHLDRVLGFNRVPPTVGRLLNVSEDIQRLANSKLGKTFFWSPAKNLCFHGSCSYYCDSSHPICGRPWMLEGSLQAFLPPYNIAKRKTWRNPWKRSYSKHRKAYWEVYNDLCEKVKVKHPYNEGRRLMDVLDMSVFDFLTGNLDRHHYETIKEFGNDTFLLHLDNGRAFGKSKYDCLSCLAPVRQCCMIRLSTLVKLVKLYLGPQSLSQMMRASLSLDPLDPVLIEPHLDALDRRLSKLLHVIHTCVQDGREWSDVVIDDGIT